MKGFCINKTSHVINSTAEIKYVFLSNIVSLILASALRFILHFNHSIHVLLSTIINKNENPFEEDDMNSTNTIHLKMFKRDKKCQFIPLLIFVRNVISFMYYM